MNTFEYELKNDDECIHISIIMIIFTDSTVR